MTVEGREVTALAVEKDIMSNQGELLREAESLELQVRIAKAKAELASYGVEIVKTRTELERDFERLIGQVERDVQTWKTLYQ